MQFIFLPNEKTIVTRILFLFLLIPGVAFTTVNTKDSFYKDIVVIKGSRSHGTGFIARDDTNVFLYTNIHVLMGQKGVSIQNFNGKKYKPESIEVAPDRDILRMRLQEEHEPQLKISSHVKPNTEITIVGNAMGERVLSDQNGKIIAFGPEKVETDAPLVSGHSGSPMFTTNGEVVGIATYLTVPNVDWVTTNTPYMLTRRFGYRIDTVDNWIEVNPSRFGAESYQLTTQEDLLIEEIIPIVIKWSIEPYWNKIPRRTAPDFLHIWISDHNRRIDRYNTLFQNLRAYKPNIEYKERWKRGVVVTEKHGKDLSKEKHANLIQNLYDENEDDNEELFDTLSNMLPHKFAHKKSWCIPYFEKKHSNICQLKEAILNYVSSMKSIHQNYEPVILKRIEK